MFTENLSLKNDILKINQLLSKKYQKVLNLEKAELKNFINEEIGILKTGQELGEKELEKIGKQGGILAVDGSNNKIGGDYPHYIELYKALGKSTNKREEVEVTDYYTPLYGQEGENPLELETDREAIRKHKLAKVEIQAALEGIEKLKPKIILMDGSLIRYQILAKEDWEELRQTCQEKNIILLGIIEDIKTKIIGESLREKKELQIEDVFYDRELLFGLLDYGQYFRVRRDKTKKSRQGIDSVFLRSSNEPSVIGIDMLDHQLDKLEKVIGLILSLTSKNSRGIPLWLDIVDSQVRISNEMAESLLRSYLDQDIFQMFFRPEREKRTL